jgi:hypothetical protein
MSLADEAIAQLDADLADAGETVTLIRGNSSASFLAVVSGYTPQEIQPGSGIVQGDSRVVLSPTGLASFPALPKRNDKLRVAGVQWNVQAVNPLSFGDTVVRIELQIRGG